MESGAPWGEVPIATSCSSYIDQALSGDALIRKTEIGKGDAGCSGEK